MKKIVYICPNGYLGGAESFVLNVCKLHQERQMFIPTILFFSDGQAVEVAHSFGIRTYILKQKLRLLNPIKLFRSSLEIHRYIKKEAFELIHLTMPYSVIVCFISLLFSNARKIWFQHGPVGGKLDFLAALLPINALLFNSNYTKDKHLSSTPCFTKLLHVLPLGVELNEREIKNPSEKLELLIVGRLCDGKNQLAAIQALHHLLIRNPHLKEYLGLKVIGSASSEKDKLYAQEMYSYVLNHQLDSVIKFIPQQKQIQPFYQKADILIHAPKNPEAFGLVIAEAMSSNLSIVAAPLGGSADLLASEEYAYLVLRPEQLELKLEEAIMDHLNPEKFDMINQRKFRCHELIRSKFNHSIMIKELEEIYEKIMKN